MKADRSGDKGTDTLCGHSEIWISLSPEADTIENDRIPQSAVAGLVVSRMVTLTPFAGCQWSPFCLKSPCKGISDFNGKKSFWAWNPSEIDVKHREPLGMVKLFLAGHYILCIGLLQQKARAPFIETGTL